MDTATFIDQVRDRAAPALPVDAAIADYLKERKEPFEDSDVENVLSRAQAEIEGIIWGELAAESADEQLFTNTTAAEAAGRWAFTAVDTWVEQIRDELLERVSVRFPAEWEDAVSWIKEEESTHPEVSEEDWRKLLDYKRQVEEILLQMERINPLVNYPWRVEAIPLFYLESVDGESKLALTWRGSSLRYLQTQVRNIAKITGHREECVTMHVLTGETWPLAPITFDTQVIFAEVPGKGKTLRRVDVETHFRSPQITQDQMLNLYRAVREEFGAAGTKFISDEDLLLLKLATVEHPTGDFTSVEDWFEAVREELAKHGSEYSSWRGPYKRYYRLLGRMGLSFSEKAKED